jgi:small-conductance mechanosensitive channel
MTTEKEQREVEQLKGLRDVQRALKQTGRAADEVQESPPVRTRQKVWIGTYLLALLLLGCVYYALRLGALSFLDEYRAGFAEQYGPLLARLTLGAMAVVVTLAAAKLVDTYAIGRLGDAPTEFNLRRVLRLLVAVVLALVGLSVLFANWYTAVVSLGLISLILGFALQTPITSLIGWVYILVRTPYRVGDRIRIGEAAGEVIDVGYLDTTLWEFGGQHLSGDHPSGLVIKFPNSDVLSKAVYNYSWPLFPYIWDEIKFQFSYDSDLDFVARAMREVVEGEVGDEMVEQVRVFRALLAQTPIGRLEVGERPTVFFRVADNTWIEVGVRYLVHPRDAGPVKNQLLLKLLARLGAEPERAKFPKGDAR